MKIGIIGTGYVGLVAGTCLANLGHEVICMDIDEKKIEKLKKGIPTIYEPGLSDLLTRNIKEKRLFFTTDVPDGIRKSEAIFIAVGTPPGKDHKADLSYVKTAAKTIGENLNGYKVIIDKSTVPVGTSDMVKETIKKSRKDNQDFDVVSNPEFLKEGDAIRDFITPDRVVVGADSDRARAIMESIYKGIVRVDKPILHTSIRSAEMIKYASNAMLATRISFMNEVANLCEKVGADVKEVSKGMGLDDRIGPRFLQAGVGYGGSCFPKDVNAFRMAMEENGVDGQILAAVENVNHAQKRSLLPKIKNLLPDLKGKTVAIWGLAFKPKTDDMREAPSLVIIDQLQKEGAVINAFDPEAQEVAKTLLKDINYFDTPYEALKGADCLVLVTEWDEFRNLDKEKMKSLMKQPIVVDGRNVYEPDQMRALGFKYEGVGRA